VHYATTLLHDTTLRYTTALLHSYTPLHFHTYPLLQKDKLIVRIDKLQYCKARRIPQGVYCDTRPFLSLHTSPSEKRTLRVILPSAGGGGSGRRAEEGAEEGQAAVEVVEAGAEEGQAAVEVVEGAEEGHPYFAT